MTFPWSVFANAPLASYHLVEDLQLGLDLSVMGHPPLFCPEATVTSELPQAEHAQASQRRRWEHGHLHTMARAPGLAMAALRRGSLAALFLVLDMVVPPLSLLVFLIGIQVVLAGAGVWFFELWSGWLVASATGFGLLFAMVLAAWARFARDVLPARILMAVPLFLLLKIPVYIRFVLRRQKAWVKTDRDR
jgi:cellulose synthase/poly-beta-1,6-N-acetylglucosamine synthase-like glycosyltransferase